MIWIFLAVWLDVYNNTNIVTDTFTLEPETDQDLGPDTFAERQAMSLPS